MKTYRNRIPKKTSDLHKKTRATPTNTDVFPSWYEGRLFKGKIVDLDIMEVYGIDTLWPEAIPLYALVDQFRRDTGRLTTVDELGRMLSQCRVKVTSRKMRYQIGKLWADTTTKHLITKDEIVRAKRRSE